MDLVSGYKNADPAHDKFQYLEDLSTAYWYSQAFFTALELKLFMHLDKGKGSVHSLAEASGSKEGELQRLLRALERMALVHYENNIWFNAQVASIFLVPEKPDYMGDFFLYRKYMRPNWDLLTSRTLKKDPEQEPELSYEQRNELYVKAMDTLVQQKAKEIAGTIPALELSGPMLDVGGGAGSMIRALQKRIPGSHGVLFEIPEVIDAAKLCYPEETDWNGITKISGDFRTHEFDQSFSLIILSNFLHAYGPDEARELLFKAVNLLGKNGIILIHDYFPDQRGGSPQKGALYDLSMMLNTFNGGCHEAGMIFQWLKQAGIQNMSVRDLDTDTSIILAGGDNTLHKNRDQWIHFAIEQGFYEAIPISPGEIITAPWVNAKCEYGCDMFGRNLQCPPNGMKYNETRKLLDSYSRAFLVRGAPPGRQFHERLLMLEKKAFLEGFHKAFVFGAGPCPVCPECPEDKNCRHHDLARPSMEGSGIDVYSTVKNAGWPLEPVKIKGRYIKYIGLFLLE